MQAVIGAIIGLLVVAAVATGIVAYNAHHGRQVQLSDDEVGRQRDAVLNAAAAKRLATQPTAATTRPTKG